MKIGLWITGLLMLSLLILLKMLYDAHLSGGSLSVIELQLAFSVDGFRDVALQWGPEGISYFRTTIWIDFLYPIAYASFLSLLLYSKGVGRLGLTLPPIAAILDMAENTIHVWQLGDLASLSPFWITIASLCAVIKWMVVIGVIGAIVKLASSRVFACFK